MGTVVLEEKWPVLGRHERAAVWLRVWADLGRAPRTLDAYAHGLAEYLERRQDGLHLVDLLLLAGDDRLGHRDGRRVLPGLDLVLRHAIAPWWCAIICVRNSLLASTPWAFRKAAMSSPDIIPLMPGMSPMSCPGILLLGIGIIVGSPHWLSHDCIC